MVDKARQAHLHPAIKLEEDEEMTHRLERNSLIGKIILNRPLGELYVKSVTSEEWKCEKEFKVSHIKGNMFMFSFQDEEDWKKVLLSAPWIIGGGLLILSPWTSATFPEEVQFSHSPFWVQVHGLPVNYLTRDNGRKIGELLGNFVCVDGNPFGPAILWNKFLRIRVVLDVRNPLLTGFWHRLAGLPDVWIEFKYEKLGLFCFKCGRIGSNYTTCKYPAGNAKFGPWLRAESWDYVRAAASSGAGASDHRNDSYALVVNPPSKPEIIDAMESDELNCGDECVPLRFLLQRLLINGIDTVAMLGNCAIIHSRAATAYAYAYESNCELLVVMAAYFLYLVAKLIRVIPCNAPIDIKEHNLEAFKQILMSLLFTVLLIALT